MSADAAIGNLAKNWPSLNTETPAIIVNPAASPLDVLAWCWGEVKSLRMAAEALSGSHESIDSDVVYAVFLHRLAPLSDVMCDAIQALAMSRKQDGHSNGGAA